MRTFDTLIAITTSYDRESYKPIALYEIGKNNLNGIKKEKL